MRNITLIAFTLLTSCVPTPESYPIPSQHNPSSLPEQLAYSDYVRATDPGAESYFLKDIKPLEGGSFRWTHANPEFRFFLKKIENRIFRLEFGIHPVIVKDLGALEMTIVVNNHPLATVRHDTAGDKVFEKAVPASWLVLNGDTLVSIRVHQPWPTTDKGVYLGFVFHGAGFIE